MEAVFLEHIFRLSARRKTDTACLNQHEWAKPSDAILELATAIELLNADGYP
jgi:hypothetical protein